MVTFVLLSLYAGTVVLLCCLANRFVSRVTMSTGLVVGLLPLLLAGRALLTGGVFAPVNLDYRFAPLATRAGELPHGIPSDGGLSDVTSQMLPWRAAVRESFRAGRFPWFNPHTLSGDILVAAAQPEALHPFTLAGMVLPLGASWTYSCAAILFLVALCAYLYLRDIGLADIPAVFGAGVWILSGFVVFWAGYPLVATFAPFPLLLLGLRRIARGIPRGPAITTVSLVLAVVGGHPESLFLLTASAGLLFLFELRQSANPIRSGAKALAAGAVAFLLCAIPLLSFLEILPQSMDYWTRRGAGGMAKSAVPLSEVLRGGLAVLFPNVYSPVWYHGAGFPRTADAARNAFVGVIAFMFAGIGLLFSRRNRFGIAITGGLCFLVAIRMPLVAPAITNLPLFSLAIPGYFAGTTGFCLAVLAALGLEHAVSQPGGRYAAGTAAVGGLSFLGLGVGIVAWLVHKGFNPADVVRFTILGTVGVGICGLLLALNRANLMTMGVLCLAVFLSERLAELPRLYPAIASKFLAPGVPEFDRLPKSGSPFRVVGLGPNLQPNQAAYYGLEDVRGYDAITNRLYAETYSLWGTPLPARFNEVNDATRPFLSFLNVRFAIAPPSAPVPSGWKTFESGKNCAIFENPRALPRAFVPRFVKFVRPSEDVIEEMRNASELATTAWIEDDGAPEVAVRNGDGTVESRTAPNGLALAVDARAPLWIVVSETAWSAWRVASGPPGVRLRRANHAFLALACPAGRYKLTLAFRPRTFPIAIGMTIAGVVAATFGFRQLEVRHSSGRRKNAPAFGRGV